MAGYTGEKRWRNGMNPQAPESGVSELAKNACLEMIDALNIAEAAYAELVELYQFAGGTVQGLANQLFKEDIEARKSPGTTAVITVDVTGAEAAINFTTDTSGVVDSVTLVDGGSGYSTGGSFNITEASDSGFTGNQAVINYTVSSGAINSVTIANGGSSYTGNLSVAIASADIPNPITAVTSASISNAGTGYNDGNFTHEVSLADGKGGGALLDYTVTDGSISSVSVRVGGNEYTTGTGQTVTNFPLAGFISDTTANSEEVAKTQAAFDAITALHELYLAADNQIVTQEDRLSQLRRMT